MRPNQHFTRLGSLILLALLSACGSGSGDIAEPPSAPAVRVVAARSFLTAPAIQGVGTAAWRRETTLGFTTGGQIARLSVNEGDRVRRGQLLATLDVTTVQAELTAAEAEAKRAASQTSRIASLYGSGWVTKSQLEVVQAAAQSSAAQVKARRFALETARIVAPDDGIVLARLAEPRQIVAAGTPVLTVGESNGGYVIRVPLNDRAAAALVRGAPAQIRFEALDAKPLTGQVLEIGSKASQSTGTFEVEISLPPDPRIRSGMIGTVSIAAASRSERPKIVVPANAILSPRAGEALVYVVDNKSRARLRTVKTGETSDAGIEILSGLSGTEWLAVTGFESIKDGLPVKIARPRP